MSPQLPQMSDSPAYGEQVEIWIQLMPHAAESDHPSHHQSYLVLSDSGGFLLEESNLSFLDVNSTIRARFIGVYASFAPNIGSDLNALQNSIS